MFEHRSGLEQEHRDAKVGEHLGDRAAARARANHHDVVDGRTRRHLGHLLLLCIGYQLSAISCQPSAGRPGADRVIGANCRSGADPTLSRHAIAIDNHGKRSMAAHSLLHYSQQRTGPRHLCGG